MMKTLCWQNCAVSNNITKSVVEILRVNKDIMLDIGNWNPVVEGSEGEMKDGKMFVHY
jgi:hypothetical protein